MLKSLGMSELQPSKRDSNRDVNQGGRCYERRLMDMHIEMLGALAFQGFLVDEGS